MSLTDDQNRSNNFLDSHAWLQETETFYDLGENRFRKYVVTFSLDIGALLFGKVVESKINYVPVFTCSMGRLASGFSQ